MSNRQRPPGREPSSAHRAKRFKFSDNRDLVPKPPGGSVSCPICGKQVPVTCINTHLDLQCRGSAAGGISSRGMAAPQKAPAAPQCEPPAEPRQRPAVPQGQTGTLLQPTPSPSWGPLPPVDASPAPPLHYPGLNEAGPKPLFGASQGPSGPQASPARDLRSHDASVAEDDDAVVFVGEVTAAAVREPSVRPAPSLTAPEGAGPAHSLTVAAPAAGRCCTSTLSPDSPRRVATNPQPAAELRVLAAPAPVQQEKVEIPPTNGLLLPQAVSVAPCIYGGCVLNPGPDRPRPRLPPHGPPPQLRSNVSDGHYRREHQREDCLAARAEQACSSADSPVPQLHRALNASAVGALVAEPQPESVCEQSGSHVGCSSAPKEVMRSGGGGMEGRGAGHLGFGEQPARSAPMQSEGDKGERAPARVHPMFLLKAGTHRPQRPALPPSGGDSRGPVHRPGRSTRIGSAVGVEVQAGEVQAGGHRSWSGVRGSDGAGWSAAAAAAAGPPVVPLAPRLPAVRHPFLQGQLVVPNFVSPAEERALLELCDDPALRPQWSPWTGTSYATATAQKTRGKRWGVLPDYHKRGVAPAEHSLPPLLRLLAERMRTQVTALQGFSPNEANAIDYRRSRGSWLRPHVDDRILSGDVIVNLSLAGAAVMTFGRDRAQNAVAGGPAKPLTSPGEGPGAGGGESHRVLLEPRTLQVWLLILAWSGLQTSAAASACCSTFRDLHRTVTAAPPLLARALLADHGPSGAAASLYGGRCGEPHPHHRIHTDEGVNAAIQELIVLSERAPEREGTTAVASSAFDTPAQIPTPKAACRYGSCRQVPFPPDSPGASPSHPPRPGTWVVVGQPPLTASHALLSAAPPSKSFPCSSSLSETCGPQPHPSLVVTPYANDLLRAAAAAGHGQVAHTALKHGAQHLDGALAVASCFGREQVVTMLLSRGADPDASEPFGPCALFEAARNGHTAVVQALLDMGARLDGTDGSHGYDPLAGAPMGRHVGSQQRACRNLPHPRNSAGLGAGGSVAVRAVPHHHHQYHHHHHHHQSNAVVEPAAPATTGTASWPAPGMPGSSAGSSDDRCHLDGSAIDMAGAASEGAEGPRTPPRQRIPSGLPAPCGARATDSGTATPPPSVDLCSARLPPPTPPPLRRPRPLLSADRPLPRLPPLPPLGSPALLPQGPVAPLPLLLWPSLRIRSTPLLAACQGGHSGVALLLLRRGARVDVTHGSELLLAGHPDIVDALLSAAPGLSVHLGTALVAAASANRADVVSALLRHGADPVGNRGMALLEAAYLGHVPVVQVLLEAVGPKLRAAGVVTAALQLARHWGRADVAELLVRAPEAP